ncbi:DUF2334 domain-containing protein [Paenibacillus cremeus]|uniref:DUF2334 domain-containing protein n=1 Tax=Paenibacillus cremeus TaxID=2163881 RepID=A0A559KE51_9BACL|nr:DUF2334 domain-containing protein [Paenibacillus cremeus]TVY10394.1 DUF2334 domain-containing protein [Paenibacillus cremeus]
MAFLRRHAWLRYVSSAIAVCLLLTAYRIITVEGEGRTPKLVLMRLEDIGPGGQYGSLEQLGKLRAVLEYLRDQHVAYHLAVVPRWINIPSDGPRYDVPLDKPDDPYTEAYRKVLHQAVDSGATLGMHGYTHQVGDVRREDGHQESGIGNEFNVQGQAETLTARFAEDRLKQGLTIMEHAGLKPQFWEAPHYHTTAEQDNVFRAYFGLNYQAEVQNNRYAPVALYTSGRNNASGASSLGAAYVPTPFDYIPFNKDEKVIIDRVGKSINVPSFYFHAFLEFKNLVPVKDENGEAVQRDGIPEYRYDESGKSLLQKLVTGLRDKGYTFYSIQDYVPFTPAQSIKLLSPGNEKQKLLLGDATGDGQTDLVTWDPKSGSVFVTEGHFRGLRNEAQGTPTQWGHADYAFGSAAALSPPDQERPCGFWIVNSSGKLERYVSDGHRFLPKGSWKIEPRRWSNLFALRQPNGDTVIAALSQDRMQLSGWLQHQGELKPLKPYRFKNELRSDLQPRQNGTLFLTKNAASAGLTLQADVATLQWIVGKYETGLPSEEGVLKFGDFNGDGLEDALRFDPVTMKSTVYLKRTDGEWKLLSFFGPWGKTDSVADLAIADFDGNGKSDLGLFNRADGFLDTALSFQSK